MLRRPFLASPLLLCSCREQDSKTVRPEIRLAVGGRAQLIYLPATLAIELGYTYEEGLNVVLQDFQGGSKSLESLLGGSSDVVCGFYDHTIQMAAQGRRLRSFLVMLQYPGLVAISASPNVSSIADLKGKNVGVSSPGSSTHMFLNYLLAKNGLQASDVTTAAIGMSASAVAAVTRGQVDAAIMTDPAVAIIRRERPNARILADARTAEGVRQIFGTASYPSAVLYAEPGWLDTHHVEAAHLVRAFQRAVAWMRFRSPEEIRARMPADFRTVSTAADIEAMRATQAMLSPDGMMNREMAEAVRNVLGVSLEAVRNAQIDVGGTFTNEFVTAQ
jgi:NitT/TauT family transport system substrate-binding protein